MPDASVCGHCGRPREAFTLELPLGLGRRTWLAECPCAAARHEAEARERRQREHQARVRQLLHQAGIGLRHSDATFESFEVTLMTRPIVEVCREFVERFPEGGAGLTLAGPPGTGKTHLAVAITRALVERGVSAVIVNVARLFLTLRSSFHGDRPQRFDELLELVTGCEHLVLDDVGRERPTEWARETLALVLDARYEDRRATSLTTNLDLDTLRARLGEPTVDRLAETNRAYWCQWPSYRRRSVP